MPSVHSPVELLPGVSTILIHRVCLTRVSNWTCAAATASQDHDGDVMQSAGDPGGLSLVTAADAADEKRSLRQAEVDRASSNSTGKFPAPTTATTRALWCSGSGSRCGIESAVASLSGTEWLFRRVGTGQHIFYMSKRGMVRYLLVYMCRTAPRPGRPVPAYQPAEMPSVGGPPIILGGDGSPPRCSFGVPEPPCWRLMGPFPTREGVCRWPIRSSPSPPRRWILTFLSLLLRRCMCVLGRSPRPAAW
jgi:hypothetical protein